MSKRPPHILLVSGLPEDRQAIGDYLSVQQFTTTIVNRVPKMLHEIEANKIDVIALDAANDDETGLETCRKLRAKGVLVPIILFTRGGDHIDRILGLELGADDCMEKPINVRELAARIRAKLRIVDRGHEPPAERYRFAGLVLDVRKRAVAGSSGQRISLTSAEFDLLAALVVQAGRKLSRAQLLDLMKRRPTDEAARSIDVLVCRIRRKLFAVTNSVLIGTVRNQGYQLISDVNPVYGADATSDLK